MALLLQGIFFLIIGNRFVFILFVFCHYLASMTKIEFTLKVLSSVNVACPDLSIYSNAIFFLG